MPRAVSSSSMEELQKLLKDRNLTVSVHPAKGRCLFTAREFSPGEVLISENPYVAVPSKSKESAELKCEWCFSSRNLKKCSSCHVVRYCGSSCQKLDWKLHRMECQSLSKIDKERVKSITPSIRLMVKLYLRRRLECEKIYQTTVTDNYKMVEALVSHMPDINEKQLVLYAQMANLVSLILQWPNSEMNIKEIAENFSKLACNAHTICNSELIPLGTGLYPAISIINHSCLPNSVLVFEGRMAVVRAVQHIPKGTEVFISYIEMAGSSITRQKALKEQYFFSCTCSRCIKLGQADDIQESAIVEGFSCKNDECSGFLLRTSDYNGFVCQRCGHIRNGDEINSLSNEVKSISDEASRVISSGNNTEASVAHKVLEKLQLKLYHRSSIYLMRTRETLLKIFTDLEDWKEALSYCRLIILVYEEIYPRVHPLIGLQYYTCGKLEWYLGESEVAVKSLTKAWDILRITHGTKSPFMLELVSKLEEARAEVSYKMRFQNDF